MPMRLVSMQFGELKVGAKFLAKIPGRKARLKLVKKWKGEAKEEQGPFSYQFQASDSVLVWRWAAY